MKEGSHLSNDRSTGPVPARRQWLHSRKLWVGATLLIAALVLGLSSLGGASGFLSVEEVVTSAQAYHEQTILVAGKVGEFSTADGVLTFTLVDNSDVNYTLRVRHSLDVPAGFGAGRHIGVEGQLIAGPSFLLLESERIQMGCSNNYS